MSKQEPLVNPENVSDDEMGQATASGPLIEHLVELRTRVFKALIATGIIFVLLFYFANELYNFLAIPLLAQLPEGSQMIATGVTSPFLAPFKLTLVLSFFLAMPVILHQAWSFISPGLYLHEKKVAVPLLMFSSGLFYGGIAFAYWVVFPLVMGFLMGIGPSSIQVMPDISEYLSICLKLFFAFGLAFQIPVATVVMVWSGVFSLDAIKQKRPYVLLGCFIFGMLLTPPDVISQVMLAVPMYVLFEVGIIFSLLFGTRGISASEAQKE